MNASVLIVDDSPTDILFLKMLLADSPFETESVSSITEAEEYLKGNFPRAVILDYLLPEGDAMPLIDKFHNTFPIILLTGMEDPDIGLKAVKRGAQDFLTKGLINKDLLIKSLQYSMERHSLKKRVNSVEKMASLGRMSSGIAHEMNTPIQYLGDNLFFQEKEFFSVMDKISQIKSLLDDSKNKDFQKSVSEILADIDLEFISSEMSDAVKQSQQGLEKLSKLVKALRTYASNETAETKKLNVNELIQETVEKYSSTYANILNINFQADPDLKSILAEESNLRQVLENILENAVFEINKKFEKSQEKGEILISTEQKELTIEIQIKDSGLGIPEDIIDHIFDPFFTTKSFSGGLGQGLAIVYRTVHEILKGTIEVYSEESCGACFIINLPNRLLN